jgi:uncharacterized membrane protein YsdA (DUF1294 family)
MPETLIVPFLLLNLFSFALFGIDKAKAKAKAWRIPEKTLLFSAVISGGIGAYLGMRVFHHKTRKPLFSIGIPCIILAEAVILFLFLRSKNS